MILEPGDILQLKSMNLTEEQVNEQMNCFFQGFPFLKIKSSASIGKGIFRFTEEEKDFYLSVWEDYLRENKTIIKFVPASGAASRMFKDLYTFLSASYDTPMTDFERDFFKGIARFPFFDALNEVCIKNEGEDVASLIADGRYKDIVSNLLEKKGVSYGSLPKGLLPFHRTDDGVRTAVEEHLVEGALYAKNAEGRVSIHFTVSPEHLPLFQEMVENKKPVYEEKFGVSYQLSFSVQRRDTETIAVDKANMPFRDVHGRLVFRPGGHGALIQNLNALDADVVFIKNIDNVSPDHLKGVTVEYKKALAGALIEVQQKIFEYIRLIESGDYTHPQVEEMIYFLQNRLYIRHPEIKYMEDSELVLYIKSKLMRPLRVCGIVKNEGEPGGGAFLAFNPDGTFSPQIIESAQVDMENPDTRQAFEESDHFNPVDIVCALKDINGKKYNLPDFVDKNTGIITQKSKDGRALKALELPGLWNGSMSDWNTVFVEVPPETFNPVKTVNDLLRQSVYD